jgi:hypothetical protein
MVRRVRGAAGESYEATCTHVTEQQEAELDQRDRALRDGLAEEARPHCRSFTKVRGVSEHPIPGEARAGRNGARDDVRVGTSDYPVG